MPRIIAVLLLVTVMVASGCTTREMQTQLWHDQHPVMHATIQTSAFIGHIVVNGVLQTAALALSR